MAQLSPSKSTILPPSLEFCRLCGYTFDAKRKKNDLLLGKYLTIKPDYTIALEELTGPITVRDDMRAVCSNCKSILTRYQRCGHELKRIATQVKHMAANANATFRRKRGAASTPSPERRDKDTSPAVEESPVARSLLKPAAKSRLWTVKRGVLSEVTATATNSRPACPNQERSEDQKGQANFGGFGPASWEDLRSFHNYAAVDAVLHSEKSFHNYAVEDATSLIVRFFHNYAAVDAPLLTVRGPSDAACGTKTLPPSESAWGGDEEKGHPPESLPAHLEPKLEEVTCEEENSWRMQDVQPKTEHPHMESDCHHTSQRLSPWQSPERLHIKEEESEITVTPFLQPTKQESEEIPVSTPMKPEPQDPSSQSDTDEGKEGAELDCNWERQREEEGCVKKESEGKSHPKSSPYREPRVLHPSYPEVGSSPVGREGEAGTGEQGDPENWLAPLENEDSLGETHERPQRWSARRSVSALLGSQSQSEGEGEGEGEEEGGDPTWAPANPQSPQDSDSTLLPRQEVSSQRRRRKMTSSHSPKRGGKKTPHFLCQECGKAFISHRDRERHVRTHSGEKPFPCPCCHRLFNDWGNMRKHLLIHSGARPYLCPACARPFSERGNLNRHIAHVHGTVPVVQCDNCRKTYKEKGGLDRHLRSGVCSGVSSH